MHHSRLDGFIIDSLGDDLDAAAGFWSAALGMPMKRDSGTENQGYIKLDAGDDLNIEVQNVNHPSRVHLDIATDDIPAEVARLEKLGAKRIADIKGWVVMAAPTGHRFCVVQARGGDFQKKSTRWE